MRKPQFLSLIAATGLLTAVASVGQPQSMDPSPPAPAGQGSSSTSSTAAPTDASTTSPSTSSTSSSSSYGTTTSTTASTLQAVDATFLTKALTAGREEVQSAQAAMASAQRAEVRNVAQMMLEDHQRANQQLESLASRKGWTLPAAATAEADQPRSASGSVSDDAFLQNEIRDHREAISLYRAQAAGGADPDLRQFARDQLPALEHHLEMLQGSHTQK